MLCCCYAIDSNERQVLFLTALDSRNSRNSFRRIEKKNSGLVRLINFSDESVTWPVCLLSSLGIVSVGELSTVSSLQVGVSTSCPVSCYHWPAEWASIVLHAGVCHLSASSAVVCNAAGRMGGRLLLGLARGQSGGRLCTAGQYGYVPLGRHLVILPLLALDQMNTQSCHHYIGAS